ncbi:E3 ubiquitin-protein ligase SPL2-like [Curcuma longa]|uniref:E3 ubiquitin-protein ligase SPL2-like n=1 Tax=Curcuma longa TaxID=136217 RepID=UPI003D9FAAF6
MEKRSPSWLSSEVVCSLELCDMRNQFADMKANFNAATDEADHFKRELCSKAKQLADMEAKFIVATDQSKSFERELCSKTKQLADMEAKFSAATDQRSKIESVAKIAIEQEYFATSTALGSIKAAPSASISGLHSILSNGEEEPVLVVVRGRVQPTSAIEAHGIWGPFKREGVLTLHGSDESAVAILSTQTCLYNEWKGMLSWSLDLQSILFRTTKEQKSSSLKLVPFILVEDSAWPNSGYVHVNLDGSTQPLPLTTVYNELHPLPATPLTFFQVMLGSGYPVALLNEEKILPVGKEVTAIGICSIRDGALEIKSCKDLPCFFTLVGAVGSEDTLSLERSLDVVGLYGGGWLHTTSNDNQDGLLFSI